MTDLFGVNMMWDANDFFKLASRMAMDLLFVWLIIYLVYIRVHKRWEFAFTCIMLNLITFSICLLLRKVPVDLGFALGLFAVFGILRYRTQPITARDLTYLFIVIGIAILNSVANKKISFAEILFINTTIVGMAAFLEYMPFGTKRTSRNIRYDRLDLLAPGKSEELFADLKKRLGLNVESYRIDDVDLLRDTARIVVTLSPSESS